MRVPSTSKRMASIRPVSCSIQPCVLVVGSRGSARHARRADACFLHPGSLCRSHQRKRMPGEYRLLNRALGEAEAAFDWLKHRRRRHRQQGCYHIQPYRGHGTAETLYISGRVFEGSPVPAARADDAYLRNLWHTTRRLGSDEVPAARVRATSSGVSRTVLADDEGFFELFLPVRTDTGEAGGEIWREIEIELLDPPPAGERIVAKGFSIVPPD